MPSLIVTSGSLAGQVFSFADSAVVGRGQFSDVRLNDATVSRRHALIRTIGERFELTDQESANGTRLRGTRITAPVSIADGDEVEFGEIKALFRTATHQHPSLQSIQPAGDNATRARAVRGQPTPAPVAPPAAAPGLRELIARMKLLCDIGALARIEEPLRDQLDRALDAILATFPHTLHAAIYANSASAEHLALITRRARKDDVPKALDDARIESFVREAMRQENGIAVTDAAARDALAARLKVADLPIAALGMPLRVGNEVLGALYLEGAQAGAWRASDHELFVGIAGQLAWLIATQRGRSPERAIDAHDLALARRIQQRFLPQAPPSIAGYRVAESYAAARVIGGDYFDFFNYRDGRTGIVIADVSGKSVSGALYMARLSVQVRALSRHMQGPAELLAGLNKKLYQELEPGMFVTMLAASLEPESGALTFACAGHPAPLLRKANGEVSVLAEPGALPLGAMSDTNFHEHAAEMAPGTCVLFYTDGLDEAHNDKNELLGKERVMKTLAENSDAQEALDALLADVARFTAGEPQSDDLTLITLSRNRR
jgi:phosphoserine phosphatase RsbU/P